MTLQSSFTEHAQRRLALTADLRELGALPLTSQADLDRWYEAAEGFRAKLYSTYEKIAPQLPHELEHYLSDADIRFKDSGYRARQDKFLTGLLNKLDEAKS